MTILSINDPPKRVYLAAPYSCDSDSLRAYRADMAGKVALGLILNGHIVFSPVSHGHQLALCQHNYAMRTDFAFWQKHCFSFLLHWAEVLAVLRLRGWEESVGVTAEIAEAQRLGLPVVFFEMDDTGGWHELYKP